MMVRSLGILIAGFVGTGGALLADSHHSKGTKHQLGAHVHGAAELGVAVEGKSVTLKLESPAEGIYGFEHEAKSEADKKKQSDALAFLKDKAVDLYKFDAKLGCKVVSAKAEVEAEEHHEEADHKHKDKHPAKKGHDEKEGEHSEVHAEASFTCEKSPAGSELSVELGKKFSGIKSLKVIVLSGDKQQSSTLKSAKGKVKL